MIKASGYNNGRQFFLLGLSGENMTRLMADEPIRVNLADLGGPDADVLIVGGRTEDAITEQLRSVGLVPPAAGG